MSNIAIKVDNLSKMYRLGVVGTGSLTHDLNRWWQTKIKGKEDPYLKIGKKNKRNVADGSQYVWSLQDINFEVNVGDALGIVGTNGAGKSTLLKILSRVTAPTSGRANMKGRIASLLEVGTGFHPELTGRENIFLNGAIMGMNKFEIRSKIDEIIDFSGVAKYVDTPVKRYSSGMYVRLAFAVAAHLEPEIMIVDEVLAVGDAEFQKKCLGKMQDVSEKEGRTVLFVSHNMQAVKNLCNKAILLEDGSVATSGTPNHVINTYLTRLGEGELTQYFENKMEAPGNDSIRIKSVEVIPQLDDPAAPIDIRTPLNVKIRFWNQLPGASLNLGLHLFSVSGECIFDVSSPSSEMPEGIVEAECKIPGNFLNDGSYFISVVIVKDTSVMLYYHEDCARFEVEDYRENVNYYGKWRGAVRPQFPFSIAPLERRILSD